VFWRFSDADSTGPMRYPFVGPVWFPGAGWFRQMMRTGSGLRSTRRPKGRGKGEANGEPFQGLKMSKSVAVSRSFISEPTEGAGAYPHLPASSSKSARWCWRGERRAQRHDSDYSLSVRALGRIPRSGVKVGERGVVVLIGSHEHLEDSR